MGTLPILSEYISAKELERRGKKCPLRYRCQQVHDLWEWYVGDGQCKSIDDMHDEEIKTHLEAGRPWWGSVSKIYKICNLPDNQRAYLYLKDVLTYELCNRGYSM